MNAMQQLRRAGSGGESDAAEDSNDFAAVRSDDAGVERCDASALSRDELMALLVRDLVEVNEGKLSSEQIDAQGHLFDFGYLDSLSGVMFLARLEERFGVAIEDIDLIETFNSVAAIADHLQRGG